MKQRVTHSLGRDTNVPSLTDSPATRRFKKQSNNTYLYGSMLLFALVALVYLLYPETEPHLPADYVIINAHVWTGDSIIDKNGKKKIRWAEAVAIREDKIIDVGTTDEMRNKYLKGRSTPATETTPNLVPSLATGPIVYDGHLHGFEMVTPGFIDTHVHVLMGGYGLTSVQLRDAHTKEEFINRIKLFAKNRAKPDSWIREGNWNHENWGGELPSHHWIDAVTAENPVFICRLDGHMCLANNVTLALAGITKDTKEVPGGTIDRDLDGNPTGILRDNAMELVLSKAPPPTEEEEEHALLAAMAYLASNGVTSIHHMGTWRDLHAFERSISKHKILTRIYAAVPLRTWKDLAERVRVNGTGNSWLKVGNLKTFTDGSLGSHTALMFEPYTDTASNSGDDGLVVTKEEDLLEWITAADKEGLHSSIHAIGDRANNILLRVYENITKTNGPKDRRFRIEHAQTLRPEEINKLKELNVIASMQPYHCIDDGVWAEKLLGPKRIRLMYPFKTLMDKGITVSFGSDWFVAPPIPLQGIFAAVTRSTLDGKNPKGWVPEQKITLEEALLAYTVNGAYASFEENKKGKIKKGFLADLVLLDQDLTLIEPHEIWNAKVVTTFAGGQPSYDSILRTPIL